MATACEDVALDDPVAALMYPFLVMSSSEAKKGRDNEHDSWGGFV